MKKKKDNQELTKKEVQKLFNKLKKRTKIKVKSIREV